MRIRHCVAAGRWHDALFAIERTVDQVFCEPLNTAEIFADAALDAACQAIGAASLRGLVAGSHPPSDARARPPLVFIASRLQRSGGHTAVLADIARHVARDAIVLLTGVGGPTRTDELQGLFAGTAVSFEHGPRGDRADKLAWLQQRLRALGPDIVWLFNHHQDSVAVAAVQPEQGYLLKYLHHGDHHLCLGVTLPFGEHYDPHAMGWHNCRHVLGRSDNRYLPMAVPAPEASPSATTARSCPLVTCTAAGHNKIEHDYWPVYAEVIASLLARTGGRHIHIGRLTGQYRVRMRRALASAGVRPDALRFIAHVPSVAQALVREQVDVYISSFPYPGARTLVEAMAAGVAIAVHDHSGKRFLGALDMAPPGSCVWSDPGELSEFLAANDRESLRRRGQQSRQHYEAFHTPEAMRAALAPGAPAAPVPTSGLQHRPDLLAQALRRSRQFSLAGLARRWAFRAARRLRSALS